MAFSDKSLRSKDFVKAAEADGFKFAVRLDQKDDIKRVIKQWLEYPGPAFLEVSIDRASLDTFMANTLFDENYGGKYGGRRLPDGRPGPGL